MGTSPMGWTVVDELPMVWWNTALTPPIIRKRQNATVDDLAFVTNQLIEMHQAFGFVILGLAEVSDQNLTHIMSSFSGTGLDVAVSPSKKGKLIYDTALIYDRTKLDLKGTAQFLDMYGKKKLKTGEMAKFVDLGSGAELYVAVSHWPSRARVGEFDPIRREYGRSLQASARFMTQSEKASFIVLMGDYNDDPSSPSLSTGLLVQHPVNKLNI